MHTNVGKTSPAPAPSLPPQMHTNVAETGHAPEPERAHVPEPETVSASALPPKILIYSSSSEKVPRQFFSFFSVLFI